MSHDAQKRWLPKSLAGEIAETIYRGHPFTSATTLKHDPANPEAGDAEVIEG